MDSTHTACGWALTLWLLLGQAGAEPPLAIGTQVFPKTDNAPVKIGAEVVATSGDVAIPCRVLRREGEWLWVPLNGKRPAGWIKRTDVLTPAEAVEYFQGNVADDLANLRDHFYRALAHWALDDRKTARLELDEILLRVPKADMPLLHAELLSVRGGLRNDEKDYEGALADFNESMRLTAEVRRTDPNRGQEVPASYAGRAVAHFNLGNYSAAQKDFSRAIALGSKEVRLFVGRGLANAELGDYQAALADYDQGIATDATNPWGWSARAWLRATCPEATYRSGEKAVADATEARRLRGSDQPDDLDTLAAAYAEAGQFKEAVELVQQALETATASQQKAFQARLALYREGKPYREQRAPAAQD